MIKTINRLAVCATLLVATAHTLCAQSLSRAALLDFANTRYHAYFHWNMCTFKNLNEPTHSGRSSGKEPVDWWNPTGMDCDQWARVVKESRMAGGWLTTKHHGGFCLWDSKFTDYDVASAPVKTDVVRRFVDAFRKQGLKVGLYYSILDYHHGIENGKVTREGIEFIKNQITELLTNYGPIDYLNFDGWSTWPTTPDFDDIPYGEIYRAAKAAQPAQPDCLIISHTYESNLAHSDVPFADAAGRSYPFHPDYLRPTAASDTLQRDWWWDDNESYGVARKSVDYLLKQLDSYNSRNSVYVLNVAPNPTGRITDDAIQRLADVAKAWKKPADLKDAGANWGFQYDVSQNLAFHRPCSQSSLHPFVRDKRAYPRAEITVDGVTEGNAMMEQTSWTLKENQPWWQVDLERDCRIHEITIYSRTDAGTNTLNKFRVSVLNRNGEVVWEKMEHPVPGPSVTLKTDGAKGRVIKIQLLDRGSLTLAEVIVQGGEL